jgi:GDP-4-dehydro-6-deoxy-D-mannose reductase
MRALVTGAGGFVGQWLLRSLVRSGDDVVGLTLDAPISGILTAEESRALRWHALDLSGPDARSAWQALLRDERPDVIIHLAGVSFVPTATSNPHLALGANVGALVTMLSAVREAREQSVCEPLMLVVGSAEQYGRHEPKDLPLTERHVCAPRTFYAATKAAQEVFALEAHREWGARVIATRSFNHSGRGQSPSFLLPSLVNRALASRKSGEAVRIGNTDTVRDFLHVADVVEAYRALTRSGTVGEVYNVCSGEGVRVSDVAAEVLAAAGVTTPLEVDTALQRAVDVPALVGDSSKLKAHTGWQPRLTRANIISDLLDAAS